MRILILTLHRKNRAPGQRFRHEQYLKDLEDAGFSITYSNLLSSRDDKVFYGKGNILLKIFIGVKSLLKRVRDLTTIRKYEYVFIYRDAFFFGTFVEKLFRLSKAKIIFDFDDSIWLKDENPESSFFQRLKNPAKTNTIIKLSDVVVAGNNYLADHASQLNKNVKVIPTSIDVNEYVPAEKRKKNQPVCIGWSGSFSTVKHFETCLNALYKIKKIYGEKVTFKVIGDSKYENQKLDIKGQQWIKKSEIKDLQEIDIGIMPLPNDLWSKGKCGLKGLQYMALEIPTIMSPVGVNSDIIEDGVNGFLAETDDEWVEKLSTLIENPELRSTMGKQGREKVVAEYSVEANKEKWLALFEN